MNINQRFLTAKWPAVWISCPGIPLTEFGVFNARKTFLLPEKPAECIVHVTADNRYRLFVNGTSVCFGPARGDLNNWRFESIDIAPYLKKGKNAITSLVWNFGLLRPSAQFTRMTAFLLQADDEKYSMMNSDTSWKMFENRAYSPFDRKVRSAVGPGEVVDGAAYPWNWEKISFNDRSWKNAEIIDAARCRGLHMSGWSWGLKPRNIPLMEETPIRFSAVRRSSGITVNTAFVKGTAPLKVPPRTEASFLLDQAAVTTAFTVIVLSGGKGSRITLTYAEAFKGGDGLKHNRNDIDGLEIAGYKDAFISGDGKDETFLTLWWRTYRYVQVDVQTGAQGLTIKDIYGIYTGYPFKEAGSFTSDDPGIREIWAAGWRTARLCAHENYMDCPYYEQLQYVGDTRIQCLISLYVSGDDRLFRNAIEQIDDSRNSEGLTRSSYPRTREEQIIPPFSLYWVCMVHDYFMHRPDFDFVKKYLNGIYNVLNWYEERLDKKTGLPGPTPYWNFVDWTAEWPWDSTIAGGGAPKGADDGGSSIIALHLAYTLNKATEIFTFFKDTRAAHYASLAAGIKKAVLKTCYDRKRGLIADTPAGDTFSQHANIHAVLAGVFSAREAKEVMRKVIADRTLIQCSFYFRFYLNQAVKLAGLGDAYVEMLAPWREMIAQGLTTFAETSDLERTRSECHAWSASPNYDLLATVAGITPLTPGFEKVRIEPHLGSLNRVSGTMPHPKGSIKAVFKRESGKLKGQITLPKGLSGEYVFEGKNRKLRSGINIL